jgi:hypothetical protein
MERSSPFGILAVVLVQACAGGPTSPSSNDTKSDTSGTNGDDGPSGDDSAGGDHAGSAADPASCPELVGILCDRAYACTGETKFGLCVAGTGSCDSLSTRAKCLSVYAVYGKGAWCTTCRGRIDAAECSTKGRGLEQPSCPDAR